MAAPFYYVHYYQSEGNWMPVGMEWQQPENLARARSLIKNKPFSYVMNSIRIPPRLFQRDYPVQNSLWHRLWFDAWKGDAVWGPQTKFSEAVSTFYAMAFLPVFLFGMFLFLWKRSRENNAISDFGWLLFLQSSLLCAGLLTFAYRYPLFDWGVFKAKYAPLVLLFAVYCISIVIHSVTKRILKRELSTALLIGLLVFMSINHLLPVY